MLPKISAKTSPSKINRYVYHARTLSPDLDPRDSLLAWWPGRCLSARPGQSTQTTPENHNRCHSRHFLYVYVHTRRTRLGNSLQATPGSKPCQKISEKKHDNIYHFVYTSKYVYLKYVSFRPVKRTAPHPREGTQRKLWTRSGLQLLTISLGILVARLLESACCSFYCCTLPRYRGSFSVSNRLDEASCARSGSSSGIAPCAWWTSVSYTLHGVSACK